MAIRTAIVGIGETLPSRRSGKNIRSLAIEAVGAALEDAGIDASMVDGLISDAGIMPNTVPHEYLATQMGFKRRFDGAMSYGGTGIVCAPMLAKAAIEQGLAETLVCYFGVDWGSRPGGPYGFHDLYPAKMAFEKPYGFSGQPSYFALWARRYMHEYGLIEDDLAQIAINQRYNSILNGNSQQAKPLSKDDYFNSRMISDPLRVADCCLISDGVCAFVITSMERARDMRKRPIEVLGCGYATENFTGDDVFTQKPDQLKIPGASVAMQRALSQAGINISDIDFAEIYDCFTISCLMQVEDLGFCNKGEAANFIREKGTTVNGKFPINTHGGLLAHSYLLGAEHVVEAVRQLRGEAGNAQVLGAKVGLVTGLSVPDYGALILGRE
jgi:acetyl-CoA acetyltransferase